MRKRSVRLSVCPFCNGHISVLKNAAAGQAMDEIAPCVASPPQLRKHRDFTSFNTSFNTG